MTNTTLAAHVAEQIGGFLHSEAVHLAPLEEGATKYDAGRTAKTVAAWKLLDFVGKVIDERKKVLRVSMLAVARKFGHKTDKGGSELLVDGHRVLCEQRVSSEPDEHKFRLLLDSHKIAHAEAYDKIATQVYNPSKVGSLVALGKLTQAEVDALREVSYALKVDASEDLTKALNEIVGK